MGYMLPLRFIEVSTRPAVSICATRIVAMMSTEIYQARRTIHEEKKAGTLINACGQNAAKTAILLDNGSVIASPKTIPVLLRAIEKSNTKASAKPSARLRVFDVYDNEPSQDSEEETADEVSYYSDQDYDDDYDDE